MLWGFAPIDGIRAAAGSDVAHCSKWLTSRLEAARRVVITQTGLICSKQNMVPRVAAAFAHMTRQEREEITDGWLLTVPRTVFDQVLQDLAKTVAKALKDRKEAKVAISSKQKKKLAGFPRFRKWQFPGSVRLQIDPAKNTSYKDHWAAGELFIPGVETLDFRDTRYVLPKTPPVLITVSRDAAGHFHATFLCVAKEYQQITGSVSALQNPLPVDPVTGLPVVRALDFSLESLCVDDRGESLGRKRHLKRFAGRLRKSNKSLARKQKGSARWHKARASLGALHVRVANCREAELRHQAKAVVNASAIVCVEDLMLAFMLQNAHLAQSAHDASFGRFKVLFEAECQKQGKLFLHCGRFDPSTQLCSACGFKNSKLKNNLSIRAWDCPSCAAHHDRDHNAAINVRMFALRRAIEILNKTEPENGFGVSKALREQIPHLRPDLLAFVARGGLTALLDHYRSRESRRVLSGSGLEEVREACLSISHHQAGGNGLVVARRKF
jgi:putative transposase